MKKILVIMMAAMFLFGMAGVAMAELPGEEYPTAADGSSYWTYKDLQDSEAKTEGGNAAFDNGTLYSPAVGDNGVGDGKGGPHGGFDTATNKCKVCHAVHRAGGAYFLLRSDSQDDACAYCHIGGSAHSAKVVYTLNSAGMDTTNGHTIGASSAIPDSSVEQSLETVTLDLVDEDGNPYQEDIEVRRYSNTKNKMFRFARHHGHGAAGTGRNGYLRIGPLALRCMNCHQPHNATNMVWNPVDAEKVADDGTGHFVANGKLTSGYKLLRKSPSASIWGSATGVNYDDGMKNHTAYTEYDTANGKYLVNASNIITVPEETMTASNTGNDGVFPNTIYTKYEGVSESHLHGYDRDPQTVTQYALSPWCADCHNLNIGYWKNVPMELGFKSHGDRTHPAPYSGAYNGPAQCYSCHRNDLPRIPTDSFFNTARTSCEQCHFGTGSYAKSIAAASPGTDSGFDFPHSGQDTAIKLLGDYSVSPSAPTTPIDATITKDNIDAVCIRCHGGVGVNH